MKWDCHDAEPLPALVKMKDLSPTYTNQHELSPQSIESFATSTTVDHDDSVAGRTPSRRQTIGQVDADPSALLFAMPTLNHAYHGQFVYNAGGDSSTASNAVPATHVSSYVTTDICLRSTNGDGLADVHYPQNPTFEEHIRAINELHGVEPTSLFMVNNSFATSERTTRPPGSLPYVAPPRQAYESSTPTMTDDAKQDDEDGDDHLDNDLRPRRQDEKLRFPGDLYTPRWVRGHGTQREGWCSLCEHGAWMQLKTSQYWYHVRFTHGVNSNTGRIYDPPVQLRVYDDTFGSTFGLCGECQAWVPICTPRRRRTFTSWFKHAHKCHRGRNYSALCLHSTNFLFDPNAAAELASASMLFSTPCSNATTSSVGQLSFATPLTTAKTSAATTATPSYDSYSMLAAAQSHPQRFSWPVSLNPVSVLTASMASQASGSSSSTFNSTSNLTTQAIQAAYASIPGGGGGGGGSGGVQSGAHRRSVSGSYV